jgi:hypothetical protein
MRVPRPSPSMVVAGVALVLASSGTTLAASHYLVTSTSQIKPSVLRALANDARGEINEVKSTWQFSTTRYTFVFGHASCPSGTRVVSGGYESSLAPGVTVTYDQPSGNGWSVVADGNDSAPPTGISRLRVHAFCQSPTP